jgi:hypothetical protein
MTPMRAIPIVLAAVLAAAPAVQAQDTTVVQDDSTIRAFLDCQQGCDGEFIRTEITFVNWVVDRADADVHLLITEQGTGGGGTEYTAAFIGLRRFQGRVDTLRYTSSSTDTDDEERRGLTDLIKLGLMPFVATTPRARGIKISYEAPSGAAAAPPRDPWNYWSFRINGNGFLEGESNFHFMDFFVGLQANRTTDAWKVRSNVGSEYREIENPEFDSTGTVVVDRVKSVSRNYEGSLLIARSLNAHWSVGFQASGEHSTRSNYDVAFKAGPGVEFDVFPYSESTRRLLAFRYEFGVAIFDYTDTTIYDKTAQTLGLHVLSGALEVRQPWGSAEFSMEASQYLHDLSKFRVELFGEFEVRLFRGLSVNAFGGVDFIRDQINLAKGGLSQSDVFLRLRELRTNYRFFTGFGVSYRFGSKFDNIVNPRYGF